MSTAPFASSIGAELSGLQALGFSDHQARSLIVSNLILASNKSKKTTPPAPSAPTRVEPIALIDGDGDCWYRVPNSADLWESPQNPGLQEPQRTIAEITEMWGPLKEVFA